IRTFWEDRAELDLRPCALEEAMREERLPACDWLILATDNHSSRLRALELWRRWDCRLLNLATDIQVREGGARMWARVTLLPRDRSWCLVCAEAVSAEEAAREEAGPDLRERLRREGYLTGVKAPAVYHLNGLCASWGVGLLHQALLDGGLAEGRDLLLNPVDSLLMEVEPPARGCWHCAPGEAAAAPDSLPRLTLPAGPGRSMEEGRTARRGPGGGARGL
ncbi:MAG: hypothetical protein Q8O14_02125, partial [bacterium]|nr:hypothetical protein [bacterium]